MHFYQNERVALFIDGANLYATAKSLGFDIDYKRLLALFRQKGQLVRALYYTALAEDQEYSSIRPLIDWLDYNGFTMVTKPTKEFTDASGRRKIKGNMDIELAVDAMRLGREPRSHRAVLRRRRLPQSRRRPCSRWASASRRLDAADAAADGRRRVAPPSRPVHRSRRSRAAHLPRSGDAPGARRPLVQRWRRRPRRLHSARPAPSRTATTSPKRSKRARGRWPPWGKRLRPEAPKLCALCPRLVAFRDENRRKAPDWFNGAVPSFGDAAGRLLIVGSGAGPQRRQSHGAAVHRRLCRRSALRDAARVRLRARDATRHVPTTACGSSTASSPIRCAACRRRTSRRPQRSPPAAAICGRASRRCRTSR